MLAIPGQVAVGLVQPVGPKQLYRPILAVIKQSTKLFEKNPLFSKKKKIWPFNVESGENIDKGNFLVF